MMSKKIAVALAIIMVLSLASVAWVSASDWGAKEAFVAYYPVHAVTVFDPECGCMQQTFTPDGDGHATQLGTSQFSGLAQGWPGDVIIQKGVATLSAANGDSLTIYYEGTGSVIDQGQHIVVDGWYTVTGGAGQFENARGKGRYYVYVYNSGAQPNDLWFSGYLHKP